MEMSPFALPPFALPLAWARMNSTDWTNMPEEPQHGIVHTALVRLQHLHQQPHDRARGVELAALPPLGQSELLKEVFVDVAQHVRGAGFGAANLDVAHHVNDLPQSGLVQGGAGVVFGQHVLERRIVPLDGDHGVVDQSPDRWAGASDS